MWEWCSDTSEDLAIRDGNAVYPLGVRKDGFNLVG